MKINAVIKQSKNLIYSSLLVAGLVACTTTEEKTEAPVTLQAAKLFAQLPESCPTPDGLAIAPDGSLTLACTNWANRGKMPGVLLSVSAEGEVSELASLPGVNGNGKSRPMGIAYAPDGSLFVADSLGGKNGSVLRLTFEDGKVATTEVVAKGLNSPNGIRYHNGAIYLTQLQMKKIKSPHLSSGIYRFSVDDRNVEVTSTTADEQLIYLAQTHNADRQYGLDGLVFDKQGNLYTGDFGDGEIFKLTLNEAGTKVIASDVYAQIPKVTGLDGIDIDNEGNLYVAGFLLNQIVKVDTNGNAEVIAQNGDTDGANGELDQPSEVLVYKDKLIISNFDLMGGKGIINTKHSAPYTLSYLDL